MNAKINALAKFLDIAPADIELDLESRFVADHEEYLVLTDEEAEITAKELIRDLLWAFNAEFVLDTCCIPNDGRTLAAFQAMQGKCCENCNELIYALISGSIGFDRFAELAIEADGRGHFISMYDGEEYEQDGFYIYRQN